jgi:hypothetical protein
MAIRLGAFDVNSSAIVAEKPKKRKSSAATMPQEDMY